MSTGLAQNNPKHNNTPQHLQLHVMHCTMANVGPKHFPIHIINQQVGYIADVHSGTINTTLELWLRQMV